MVEIILLDSIRLIDYKKLFYRLNLKKTSQKNLLLKPDVQTSRDARIHIAHFFQVVTYQQFREQLQSNSTSSVQPDQMNPVLLSIATSLSLSSTIHRLSHPKQK